MNLHRPEYLDLCAGWALDALDDADRRRLEAHLKTGCAECERALAEFSVATVALAASAPAALPSSSLRGRVLAAATGADEPRAERAVIVRRPTELESAHRRFSPWTWVPVAAAAAFVLVSALLWMQAARQSGELAATRARIAELEQQAAADREWERILTSAYSRVAVLAPTTDGDPGLRARVVYDPGSGRAVVMAESLLPQVERDYELWVIRGGAPVSLGVMATDDQGRVAMRLEGVGAAEAISAFAVSVEPRGGSPNKSAPSGPVVMLGPLGS